MIKQRPLHSFLANFMIDFDTIWMLHWFVGLFKLIAKFVLHAGYSKE